MSPKWLLCFLLSVSLATSEDGPSSPQQEEITVPPNVTLKGSTVVVRRPLVRVELLNSARAKNRLPWWYDVIAPGTPVLVSRLYVGLGELQVICAWQLVAAIYALYGLYWVAITGDFSRIHLTEQRERATRRAEQKDECEKENKLRRSLGLPLLAKPADVTPTESPTDRGRSPAVSPV
ncbi:unnamed protein product, partial [Mesorhabditis spiculigera]